MRAVLVLFAVFALSSLSSAVVPEYSTLLMFSDADLTSGTSVVLEDAVRGASSSDPLVTLTTTTWPSIGGFFYQPFVTLLPISDLNGWRSSAVFKLPNVGEEGFAFVANAYTPNFISNSTEPNDLGYRNSEFGSDYLAVRVDTTQTVADGEPSGTHVAIDFAGEVTRSASLAFDIQTGNSVTLEVIYTGSDDNRLFVLIDEVEILEKTNVNLDNIDWLFDNKGYVGFTAATGPTPQTHLIEEWIFQSITVEPTVSPEATIWTFLVANPGYIFVIFIGGLIIVVSGIFLIKDLNERRLLRKKSDAEPPTYLKEVPEGVTPMPYTDHDPFKAQVAENILSKGQGGRNSASSKDGRTLLRLSFGSKGSKDDADSKGRRGSVDSAGSESMNWTSNQDTITDFSKFAPGGSAPNTVFANAIQEMIADHPPFRTRWRKDMEAVKQRNADQKRFEYIGQFALALRPGNEAQLIGFPVGKGLAIELRRVFSATDSTRALPSEKRKSYESRIRDKKRTSSVEVPAIPPDGLSRKSQEGREGRPAVKLDGDADDAADGGDSGKKSKSKRKSIDSGRSKKSNKSNRSSGSKAKKKKGRKRAKSKEAPPTD